MAFKAKMATEKAPQIDVQRSRTSEVPHAWIKRALRLTEVSCRTWASLPILGNSEDKPDASPPLITRNVNAPKRCRPGGPIESSSRKLHSR